MMAEDSIITIAFFAEPIRHVRHILRCYQVAEQANIVENQCETMSLARIVGAGRIADQDRIFSGDTIADHVGVRKEPEWSGRLSMRKSSLRIKCADTFDKRVFRSRALQGAGLVGWTDVIDARQIILLQVAHGETRVVKGLMCAVFWQVDMADEHTTHFVMYRVTTAGTANECPRRRALAVGTDEEMGPECRHSTRFIYGEPPPVLNWGGGCRRRPKNTRACVLGCLDQNVLEPNVVDADSTVGVRKIISPAIRCGWLGISVSGPEGEGYRIGRIQNGTQAKRVNVGDTPRVNRLATNAIPKRRFAFDQRDMETGTAKCDREGAPGDATTNNGGIDLNRCVTCAEPGHPRSLFPR